MIEFGPFTLWAKERRLERNGVAVKLGSRALDILIVLAERAGEVVSNQELTARVWPDTTVEESGLRVQITALRKALREGKGGARYVTNVPGRGYSLVAQVSRPEARPAAPATPARPATTAPSLPPRLGRIVGRDDVIRDVAAEVARERFVTVVGPGGMGKTTVAVAVAHALVESFAGDVRFVDLGSLSDPRNVASSVASAVGVVLAGGEAEAISSLVAFLQDRRTLLVLDSCEHVISAAAPLAERLFNETAQVHLLATSREALRVQGERVHRLTPLDSPPEGASLTAAEVASYPAVQLFAERATAGGARFSLGDDDAPVVAEICRRLDGIALAIEFAAGRVDAYGVRGTASLLENRFRLLWHGRRTALARHQTLSSMLDWSYNLLDEVERAVLRRLAVLVGIFELDDVAAVAGDDALAAEDAEDALERLVEKSLVAVETAGAEVRYRLLDSTRAYAQRRLEEAGERDATLRRLAVHLARTLDDEAGGKLGHPATRVAHVRAALTWVFSDRGDAGLATALAAAAAEIFMELSLLSECRRWAETALAALGSDERGTRSEMRLQAAFGVSSMFTRGNSPEAQAALVRGLALADELGDVSQQMRLLTSLDIFFHRLLEFRQALGTAERIQAIAERLRDPEALRLSGWILGTTHHLLGNQVEAERYCRSALTSPPLKLHFGFDHRIRSLVALGRALWLRGRAEDAVEVARQTIRDAAEIGQPVTVAISLIWTSSVFLWRGDLDAAGEILGRLVGYAEKHGLGPYLAVGHGLEGELLVKRGAAAEGLVRVRSALDLLGTGRHQIFYTVFLTAVAEALGALGRFDEALPTIEQAIAATAKNHGSVDLPEMLRLKGQLLGTGPTADGAEAERFLRQALDLAREQGALAWELRAAMALARLFSAQGRTDEARVLLNEIYGRFAQGLETADLRAARQLLDELSPPAG